jgi:hypothetical protein
LTAAWFAAQLAGRSPSYGSGWASSTTPAGLARGPGRLKRIPAKSIVAPVAMARMRTAGSANQATILSHSGTGGMAAFGASARRVSLVTGWEPDLAGPRDAELVPHDPLAVLGIVLEGLLGGGQLVAGLPQHVDLALHGGDLPVEKNPALGLGPQHRQGHQGDPDQARRPVEEGAGQPQAGLRVGPGHAFFHRKFP